MNLSSEFQFTLKIVFGDLFQFLSVNFFLSYKIFVSTLSSSPFTILSRHFLRSCLATGFMRRDEEMSLMWTAMTRRVAVLVTLSDTLADMLAVAITDALADKGEWQAT